MYEFSIIGGFVEKSESLGDMIKYIANEPSVGLYYIQQHVQNAVPNVAHLKSSISDKSRETLLRAVDLEDSIDMVSSMKECGFPIAEEMIGDIKKSLAIMSTKQPIRGLIRQNSSSFWMGSSSSSWGPTTWNNISGNIYWNDGEMMGGGYLSAVFRTAKQKAESFKWPQLDLKELRESPREQIPPYPDILAPTLAGTSESDRIVDGEADEAAVPGETGYGFEGGEGKFVAGKMESDAVFCGSKSYDSFKADREAKLEEWLEGTNGSFSRI